MLAQGCVEAVEKGQLLDRAPPQALGEAVSGIPRGDVAGGRELRRDPEQLLDLLLELDRERGEGGGDAEVAQGEAEVLDDRVDRGAADDAEPAEVGVGRVGGAEVGADDDDRRVLGKGLGEVVALAQRLADVGEARPGRPPLLFAFGDLDRGPAAGRRLYITAPGAQVELAERPFLLDVADDQEADRLAVATLRAEAGGLDGVVEDLLGDRVGEVVPAGEGDPHRVSELHRRRG